MKKYTQPELHVTAIVSEDVITLSGLKGTQSVIKSVKKSEIDF